MPLLCGCETYLAVDSSDISCLLPTEGVLPSRFRTYPIMHRKATACASAGCWSFGLSRQHPWPKATFPKLSMAKPFDPLGACLFLVSGRSVTAQQHHPCLIWKVD